MANICVYSQVIDKPGIVDNPREVSGIFYGNDQRLDENGKLITYCTLYTPQSMGVMSWISLPGSCSKNRDITTATIDQLFLTEIYQVICTGLGKGNIFYADIQGGYICGTFERKGDKVFYSYGFFAESPKMIKCPLSPFSKLGKEPNTLGEIVFQAADDFAKKVTKDMYTCQF